MKFLYDFFPILLFFIAFKTHGIYAATVVAIVASLAQVGWFRFRHGRFETMHLVTLALIVVFGGATLILHDKQFIMWKPTVLNWLFALAFLGSQFVGRQTLIERLMGHAINVPAKIWSRMNLAWVVFFLALGVANLYVADRFWQVESQLASSSGQEVGDLDTEDACHQRFQDELLALCLEARDKEADWVNFKLFGMLGLTFAFVIGQAFYMARHMIEDEPEAESNG